MDENAAKRLAKIAGVDIEEFSTEMFEAGEKLDGKTPEEVFLQDFKVFMCGDIRFGVAQGSYMTRKNLQAAQALLQPYLEEARNKQNVEDLYMLLTDVPKEESVVICTGRYAAEVLSNGFESRPAADGSWTLPGVVSRKKQFIPAMMSAYQERYAPLQNTKPPEPCMFRGLLCFVRERQAATFKGELSVQMVPSKSFVTASVPFTLTRAGSSA